MKQKYKYTVREVLIRWLNDELTNDKAISMLQETLPEEWPKVGDKYYLSCFNTNMEFTCCGDNFDKWRKNLGLIFRTREEAETKYKEIMNGGKK